MSDFELIPIDDIVSEPEKQHENTKKLATPASWKPGQSGNPNGRPHKGYSITEAVKDLLTKEPERKKKIIEKIIALAENGDPVFVKLAWNYMDGMPTQQIEQTGELNLNVNGMLSKVYGDSESDGTI